MSPSSIVREGAFFVALKSYLDGSGIDTISLTLAAVSADEGVWGELEPAWDEILKEHCAPYSHMKELAPLEDAFATWSPTQRDSLLDDLVDLLAPFRENPRICRISCSVDMRAYSRYAKQRNHPLPERLCARV